MRNIPLFDCDFVINTVYKENDGTKLVIIIIIIIIIITIIIVIFTNIVINVISFRSLLILGEL